MTFQVSNYIVCPPLTEIAFSRACFLAYALNPARRAVPARASRALAPFTHAIHCSAPGLACFKPAAGDFRAERTWAAEGSLKRIAEQSDNGACVLRAELSPAFAPCCNSYDLSAELREETKSSVHDGLFDSVDGSPHHPPPGFTHADSFKTSDRAANLQLTFHMTGAARRN
ncbi:MAG TPA: hypothetical protein VF525_02850 [Pyrinomonadaceae bacterium]